MATDIATVLAPASKLCLLGQTTTLTHGFLTSQNVEKAFDILSCFPKDSPQFRAYGLLGRLLYSRNYGTTISSLRGNNAGLIAYFDDRLKTDQAFFDRSKAFYSDVKDIDQKFFFTEHPELISKIPNLSQVAGEGAFSNLAPGWLWTLAMKHAGQDPIAAIEMIGICGHDDTHFGTVSNGRGDASFDCPMRGGTLFYTPRSLGEAVDLDQPTKTWIASIQAPNLGMAALPSKAYHFYGSALFSCLMKAQGLPDAEIRASNALVARLYRGIDMRNRVILYKSLSVPDQGKTESEIRSSCQTLRGRVPCPDFRTQTGYDQAREDRFVAGKLTEYDTYFLIDRWKMIKSLPVLGLPLDFDLNITPAQAVDRPAGWSTERFDKAVMRLRTYAVDYAWSEKQHLVGSNFALSHCGR